MCIKNTDERKRRLSKRLSLSVWVVFASFASNHSTNKRQETRLLTFRSSLVLTHHIKHHTTHYFNKDADDDGWFVDEEEEFLLRLSPRALSFERFDKSSSGGFRHRLRRGVPQDFHRRPRTNADYFSHKRDLETENNHRGFVHTPRSMVRRRGDELPSQVPGESDHAFARVVREERALGFGFGL